MGSEGHPRRPFCNRCSKPSSLCLCSRLLSPPIDNPIAVTILQHSLESSHPLNSTRVARLGFKNLTVVPVTDVNFHAHLLIRPLEPSADPNWPSDGGNRGNEANSADADGVLDPRIGCLEGLGDGVHCGKLNSSKKSDFLAAQIGASDELVTGGKCGTLDSENRLDFSAARTGDFNDFDANRQCDQLCSSKRPTLSAAQVAVSDDGAADKQCGDWQHQFLLEKHDSEHGLTSHSCSSSYRHKEERCFKKPFDPEIGIPNGHASSVCCGNRCDSIASEMHDSELAQASPKGWPLPKSNDVNQVRERPGAEDNEITVTSDKCRITCSLSDIKMTVERGVKPNRSWFLSTQVGKAAMSNGFMVRKVQRKQLRGTEKFEDFEEFDIVIPPGSAVLYPCEKSISLEEVNFEVKHLIVLDGTWGKARRVYCENPWLMLLPRLKLDSGRQSLYSEVRHEPRSGCLSTVESIVCAMKGLGDDIDGLDELLNVFESMIEDQRRCKDEKFRRLNVS